MALNQSLVGTRSAPLRSTVTEASLAAWRAALGLPPEGPPPLIAGLSVAAAAITPPLLDPRLGADMMRLGQVTHRILRLSPVAAGDALETVATIAGITPTEAGERLDLHLVASCGDRVVVEAEAGVLLRGPRRRTHADDAVAAGSGEASGISVDADRVARLCEALGDHNPLFVDDDAARQAGLPGCIAPNLGLFAMAWSATGEPPTLSATFHRPALVGDVVRVVRDGARFRIENQVGVVLVDGNVGGAG